MNLLHAGREDDHLDTLPIKNIGITAAATETHLQILTEDCCRRPCQTDNRGVFRHGHAREIRTNVYLDFWPDALTVNGACHPFGSVFEAGQHMFGLLLQFLRIMTSGFTDYRDFLRHDIAGDTAIDTADIGGRFEINAPQAHLADSQRSSLNGRKPLFRGHSGMRGNPFDFDIQDIGSRRLEHHPADSLGIQGITALCPEQTIIQVLGPHQPDLFGNRHDHLDRSVLKLMLTNHLEGFNNFCDAGLVICAKHGITSAVKYTVAQDRLDLTARLHRIHMH